MAALPLVAVALSFATAVGMAVSHLGGPEEERAPAESADDLYDVEVFRAPGGHGFGYRIRRGNRGVIRQPHVPGLPGLHGFESSADARDVARFVVDRIRSGHMPPSVSREDLDSLGVSWIEGR